jgi:flagellar protein FlaJ
VGEVVGRARLRLVLPSLRSRSLDIEDLFLLVHLYALISSGSERRDAIYTISMEERIYKQIYRALRFIDTLVRGWGYDMVSTLVIVSRRIGRTYTREFFERLSQVIGSGADLVTFLRNEIESSMVSYISQMDKSFEAVRVLFSLFSTSMSTSVFLLANMVILSMLLGGGESFVSMVTLGLLLSLAILALMVTIMIPRDPIILSRSDLERRVRRYLALSIITGISLFICGYTLYPHLMIIPVTLLSIPLIVFGRLIIRIESRVSKYDDTFPAFVRSLGHLLHVVPDMRQSIRAIMRGSLGVLEKKVDLLRRRLYMGVSLEKAWSMMLDEMGSRLCYFSGKVLLQTLLLQGDVRGIGKLLGDVIGSICDLRKKRSQMARAFESTILMLHLLVSAILGLIITLVSIFSQIASLPGQSVLTIAPLGSEFISRISLTVIMALSIVNGLVSRAMYPGGLSASIYHIGVLLSLGYVVYIVTSTALSNILAGVLGQISIVPNI